MRSKSIENAFDTILARIGAVPLLMIVSLAMLLPGFVTLPPMDRDEPRFAQASKQMLETGDFVDIRFGDEARNKKPVGIHWMQAAVVGLAEFAHVPDARQQIWLYRIPSLFGAVSAVLLTYWAARAFVSSRGAVVAALLLAATPLLGAEARLATTDAVLVATVTAAMGALARLYLADATARRNTLDHDVIERDFVQKPALAPRHHALGLAAIFWTAIGIGILIKGPINPMIPAFAAVVLSIRARSARWLGGLHPLLGLCYCLAIVLPWFVLIFLKTQGTYFTEAVGHDLLGKLAGAQEMHGEPPGFYLAAFWLTGWPMAPFVAVVAPILWRERRDPRVGVLLAWLVPTWLLFEVTPTKLVHYGLPLYPALAILAAFGIERAVQTRRELGAWSGAVLFGLLALVPAVVLGLVTAGQGRLWTLGTLETVLAVSALLASVVLAWNARHALVTQNVYGATSLGVLVAMPVYLFVFGYLLSPSVSEGLAVSPRLAHAASAAFGGTCGAPLYAAVGSHEPSLMFATNAKLLMTDATGVAKFMGAGPCRAAFVERREDAAFKAALDPDAPVREAARIEGIAINGGRALDIGVYLRQ